MNSPEITIVKATPGDAPMLAELGKQTFVESHGPSASKVVIDEYTARHYTSAVFEALIQDGVNHIYILKAGNVVAGYSMMQLNVPHPRGASPSTAKLDRLYFLKEYHDLKLGWRLLRFNIELSKKQLQNAMWLYAWKGNERAVNFYKKAGFEIIGSHDFKLTDSHSNPNHLMLLEYLSIELR